MKVKGINFSNKYITGSAAKRDEKVKMLCSNIYPEIIYKYSRNAGSYLRTKDSSISFHEIEKLIKNNLPEPVKFYIAKEKKSDTYDGCIKLVTDNNSIVNYRMELPLKDKNLHISKVPTLMHELRHLLDFAINPQYRTVYEKMMKADILGDTGEFFKKVYYTKKSCTNIGIIRKTKKFLKNYTNDEAILILKFLELQTKTENNGFGAAKLYGNKMSLLYGMPYIYDYREYRFNEKLDLIKNMRRKMIEKERRKNKIHNLFKNRLNISSK